MAPDSFTSNRTDTSSSTKSAFSSSKIAESAKDVQFDWNVLRQKLQTEKNIGDVGNAPWYEKMENDQIASMQQLKLNINHAYVSFVERYYKPASEQQPNIPGIKTRMSKQGRTHHLNEPNRVPVTKSMDPVKDRVKPAHGSSHLQRHHTINVDPTFSSFGDMDKVFEQKHYKVVFHEIMTILKQHIPLLMKKVTPHKKILDNIAKKLEILMEIMIFLAAMVGDEVRDNIPLLLSELLKDYNEDCKEILIRHLLDSFIQG